MKSFKQFIYEETIEEEIDYSTALRELMKNKSISFKPKGAMFSDGVELFVFKDKDGWIAKASTGEELGPFKSQKQAAQKILDVYKSDLKK